MDSAAFGQVNARAGSLHAASASNSSGTPTRLTRASLPDSGGLAQAFAQSGSERPISANAAREAARWRGRM